MSYIRHEVSATALRMYVQNRGWPSHNSKDPCPWGICLGGWTDPADRAATQLIVAILALTAIALVLVALGH